MSLKIRYILFGLLVTVGLAGFSWLIYDYYTLRVQHQQILLYLVQPVKTDAKGMPVQRAQALDELIPRSGDNGTGSAGK